VIAHRLQTLRHADLVVALDAGRVVEAGPPGALLRGSGTFGRWWGEASTGRPRLTVD
jgi:ABC-type multidrug transport system fused ATPase/permease subunit